MNYATDRLDRRERFEQGEKGLQTGGPTGGGSVLAIDLERAHSLLKETSSTSIREGHELAGRTLRDGGFCAQATFHYAMAWMFDENDVSAAGECDVRSVIAIMVRVL